MLELPKIDIGTSIVIQKEVKEEDTALNYGSGKLDTLLATPALAALMIEGAVKLIDEHLPEGIITVGKSIHIEHEKPTGLGVTVSVKVEVVAYNPPRISFNMIAYDEMGVVGNGIHERRIVNKDILLSKTSERAEKIVSNDY